MDDKKKILLGEKDIISRDNEDLFINLNLNKTFAEIRNERYDNIFDVFEQFNKERNESRNFRIYGIVDSTKANTDNLTLYIYSSETLSSFVKTAKTSSLVYYEKNAFNKRRGKYILELDNYQADFVYIRIPTDNLNYGNQLFSQQLVFKDVDNNFVPYGTETVDINENGETIELNNDFYFFYNKHWIKKDLNITRPRTAYISISAKTSPNTIVENNSTGATFAVTLDEPSSLGLEKVDLNILARTLDLTSTEIELTDENFNPYPLPPFTLSFSPGEKTKIINFISKKDTIQELVEDVSFGLNNFQDVKSGHPITHRIIVDDGTPKRKAIFNFQDIYQNRNYFYGQRTTPFSSDIYTAPMPAVLRNGLKFEGTPMEFYPIDEFTLKIKNIGNSTLLEPNPDLNILSTQVFPAGQELTFNIKQKYKNTQKHSIRFNFKTINSPLVQNKYFTFTSGVTINSVPLIDYWNNAGIAYDTDTMSKVMQKLPITINNINYNIGGWNRFNLDIPFDVITDFTGKTITITAKSPGTRLDVKTYGLPESFGSIFNPTSQAAKEFFTATTIQPFVYSAQTPLKITLNGNFNANSEAAYQFTIEKIGYDTMTFQSSGVSVSTIPQDFYLISSFRDILRNWDNSTNKPVYIHSGVTSNWPYNNQIWPAQNYSFYKYGEVYINGIVLLANKYFDNTTNASTYLTSAAANSSHFINYAGTYSANFKIAPLAVIPETSSELSPFTKSQESYIGITYGLLNYAGLDNYRSFNFRTGFTNQFITAQIQNPNAKASLAWSANYISATGGTTNPATSLSALMTPRGVTNSNVSWQETTYLNNLFKPLVNFPDTTSVLKLKMTSPGVPLQISNIINQRYTTGGTANSLFYVDIQPYEIAYVTTNMANNHMGGFSLIPPP